MLRPVDQQYQIMIWMYDYNSSDSQRLEPTFFGNQVNLTLRSIFSDNQGVKVKRLPMELAIQSKALLGKMPHSQRNYI